MLSGEVHRVMWTDVTLGYKIADPDYKIADPDYKIADPDPYPWRTLPLYPRVLRAKQARERPKRSTFGQDMAEIRSLSSRVRRSQPVPVPAPNPTRDPSGLGIPLTFPRGGWCNVHVNCKDGVGAVLLPLVVMDTGNLRVASGLPQPVPQKTCTRYGYALTLPFSQCGTIAKPIVVATEGFKERAMNSYRIVNNSVKRRLICAF
ncbi:hypothetical protein BJ165DRAFT_1410671 [Panaeolus papilionaceus]|nr:hypothetical protein BJ165DRAFT_1410671 [Panaeolus papilionaceus]